jgi:hypothetical protein
MARQKLFEAAIFICSAFCVFRMFGTRSVCVQEEDVDLFEEESLHTVVDEDY